MQVKLLQDILHSAKKIGGIYSDIFIEEKHNYSGFIVNDQIEDTFYGVEIGISVRVIFANGRNINITTSDLTKLNLRRIGLELLKLPNHIDADFKATNVTEENIKLFSEKNQMVRRTKKYSKSKL
ncbi:MAG: hypothetical protein KAX49_14805 [Halanaerobiales bacterium]|nr:hypothetical protein [Halanaerobiales bacterium]